MVIVVILKCTFYDNETLKWQHSPVPAEFFLPDLISHSEPGAFLSNLSVSAHSCHYSHQMSPPWPLNLQWFLHSTSTSSLSSEHDKATSLLVKLTVLRSANRLWCHRQNNVSLYELVCVVCWPQAVMVQSDSPPQKAAKASELRGKGGSNKKKECEWMSTWMKKNTQNYRVTHVSYHYTDHQANMRRAWNYTVAFSAVHFRQEDMK